MPYIANFQGNFQDLHIEHILPRGLLAEEQLDLLLTIYFIASLLPKT